MRVLTTFRNRRFIKAFRKTLRQACERGNFRVVHYSIQRNHVHLLVEARGKDALGRGMKAVGTRLVHAVHRVYQRKGPVLHGRYHVRSLRTPTEVRNALAYVLLNVRKHYKQKRGVAPPVREDEASSARWFSGWKGGRAPPAAQGRSDPREVAEPHTWMLRVGWRALGLIDPAELPGRV